jgi:hypothetical protein
VITGHGEHLHWLNQAEGEGWWPRSRVGYVACGGIETAASTPLVICFALADAASC